MSIKFDGDVITVEEFATAYSSNEAVAAVRKKYGIPGKSLLIFSDALEMHYRDKWLVKLIVRVPPELSSYLGTLREQFEKVLENKDGH